MKALVLCGGIPQIALIQELKNRGIFTLLADMNENVVARPYADKFCKVSVLDVEGVTRLAREQQVDFLITVCADQVLQVVAEVSERLGLPCYIDFATAENVSKKSYMKRIFAENDIPTSRFVIMDTFEEEKIAHLQYPLIVKPVDAYSSRGVTKVTDPNDTAAAFALASDISRTGRAIVEEFVEGDEISVDVYVEEGTAHVLCLTNLYKIGEDGKFIIHRSCIPAEVSDTVATQIGVTAQKIADAFCLTNTPMLIQLITDGERISVVEFCARTGGGVKFMMIKKFSSFDVVKAVVDLTLGNKPHVEPFEKPATYTVNEFVYCHAGTLDRLEGFEDLLNEGVIADYKQFKSAGTVFNTINGSGDRVAYFSIEASSKEELLRLHQEANARIRAVSTKGADLIRHDLIARFGQ
ncbi:MAG: ATP-grasp domain-containing protein [Clostridia bacterium]|nr:ATP-grasp domain-containing protein [Clostridia bacterium]